MTMNIKNIKNLRVKLMSMATVLFVGLMGFSSPPATMSWTYSSPIRSRWRRCPCPTR